MKSASVNSRTLGSTTPSATQGWPRRRLDVYEERRRDGPLDKYEQEDYEDILKEVGPRIEEVTDEAETRPVKRRRV